MELPKLNKTFSYSKSQLIAPLKNSTHYSIKLIKRNLKPKLQKIPPRMESTRDSILTQMQSRKDTRSLEKIEPELAAKVIKQYLLPMFGKSNNQSLINSRYTQYGYDSSVKYKESIETIDTSFDNTVFGEMKLSLKLADELEDVKKELKNAKEHSRLCEQSKIITDFEHNELRRKYDDLLINYEILKFQTTQSIRNYQKTELQQQFVVHQLDEFKSLYITEQTNKVKLSERLHDQLAKNDKYKLKTLEFLHTNDLLANENLIIGERLKGLYVSFQQLIFEKSSSELLDQEIKKVVQTAHGFAEEYQQSMQNINAILHERNELRNEIIEMARIKEEAKHERDKIIKIFKEKVTSFNNDIKIANDERDRYKSKSEDSEGKLVFLSEEYDRLRSKMKQFNIRRSSIGDYEEKLCNCCKKVYIEKDNYNWSCKNHTSQFSGQQ